MKNKEDQPAGGSKSLEGMKAMNDAREDGRNNGDR